MPARSSQLVTVEVRGAFDGVEDISAVSTPFTLACDGYPRAPIAEPIVVRSAKHGDVVTSVFLASFPSRLSFLR
jgi:hypothetical protein